MNSHFLAIHLSVLLFGLSGLFAKLLVISPLVIVWWRCLFAAGTLGVVVGLSANFALPTAAVAATGVVLADHWVAFFHSIQVSTVAVGLLSFSVFPVVVALIEPLFEREPFQWSSLRHALLALGGVVLVVPDFHLESAGVRGVA